MSFIRLECQKLRLWKKKMAFQQHRVNKWSCSGRRDLQLGSHLEITASTCVHVCAKEGEHYTTAQRRAKGKQSEQILLLRRQAKINTPTLQHFSKSEVKEQNLATGLSFSLHIHMGINRYNILGTIRHIQLYFETQRFHVLPILLLRIYSKEENANVFLIYVW